MQHLIKTPFYFICQKKKASGAFITVSNPPIYHIEIWFIFSLCCICLRCIICCCTFFVVPFFSVFHFSCVYCAIYIDNFVVIWIKYWHGPSGPWLQCTGYILVHYGEALSIQILAVWFYGLNIIVPLLDFLSLARKAGCQEEKLAHWRRAARKVWPGKVKPPL